MAAIKTRDVFFKPINYNFYRHIILQFSGGFMASLVIDNSRLSTLINGNQNTPAADMLLRERGVFFVGGVLPAYETLATMFDSFCMEATVLFYLTFGPRETYSQGEEMARQIKKNFNVRLIASLDSAVEAATLERIYAAGVDNVVLRLEDGAGDFALDRPDLPLCLQAAREVFPRWGTAATLLQGEAPPIEIKRRIDRLLAEGIVPLVRFASRTEGLTAEAAATVLQHLVSGWEKSSVPLPAYLPLISIMAPLVATKPAGLWRSFVDRFRDRQQLAGSDIRRHLRVQHAEDSLDSAGL